MTALLRLSFWQYSLFSAFCGIVLLITMWHPLSHAASSKDHLWGQALTGVDLAREETLTPLYSPTVMIVDSGFIRDQVSIGPAEQYGQNDGELHDISHGTKVVNVMFGPLPFGFSTGLANPTIGLITTAALSQKLPVNLTPDILCASVHIFRDTAEAFNNIANRSVLVLASGNDFPSELLEGEALPNPVNVPYINVGALSSKGVIASYSSRAKNLTAVAPSDSHFLYLKNAKGALENFNGTSAAQPIVCSAVQMLMTDLGKLTVDQVTTLINNSSLPVLNNDRSSTGAGLINFYKLRMITKRLRALGWDLNTEEKKKDLLLIEPTLYDFSANISNKADFKDDRKSFFLNPTEKSALRLADDYKRMGLKERETYYRSLSEPTSEFIRNSLSETFDKDYRRDIYRAIGQNGPIEFPEIVTLAKSIDFHGDIWQLELNYFLVSLFGLKAEQRFKVERILFDQLQKLDGFHLWSVASNFLKPLMCLPEANDIREKIDKMARFKMKKDYPVVFLGKCSREIPLPLIEPLD